MKLVNQLDIQTLQQTKRCVEGNKNKSACKFSLEWSQSRKSLGPCSDLSMCQNLCFQGSLDTWLVRTLYHTMSLLDEFNPLVAGLQAQQLRQLPYGWGMLLVSLHCSIVLLTTSRMNALSSSYSQRAVYWLALNDCTNLSQEWIQKTKGENSTFLTHLRLNLLPDGLGIWVVLLGGSFHRWDLLPSVCVASQGIVLLQHQKTSGCTEVKIEGNAQ